MARLRRPPKPEIEKRDNELRWRDRLSANPLDHLKIGEP